MFMLLDVVSSAGVPDNGTEVRLIGNNNTTSSPCVIVGNGTDDPMVRTGDNLHGKSRSWVKCKERGEDYSVTLDEGEAGRVALTVKHSD